MRKSDPIWAALMMFTRLPFWRWKTVPAEAFQHCVTYWPLSGWLTGSALAGTFYMTSLWYPVPLALTLAFLVRLLLTGALHEDGLADFCDGMGGGRNKEDVLRIMKDSHTGTYGILGLIVYTLLVGNSLIPLPPHLLPFVLFTGDVYGKICASALVNRLPYARHTEEAKNKTVYIPLSKKERRIHVFRYLLFLAPLIVWCFIQKDAALLLPALLLPPIVTYRMISWIRKRIQGYTGDCCGALFLICELSFYLAVCLIAP